MLPDLLQLVLLIFVGSFCYSINELAHIAPMHIHILWLDPALVN